MENVVSAIKSTISISLFNRGMAGKIFKMVKESGPKVVMKNNMPECVLLSPEEYVRLVDEANDAKLELLAAQRLLHMDTEKTISAAEVFEKYGISEKELEDADGVDLE